MMTVPTSEERRNVMKIKSFVMVGVAAAIGFGALDAQAWSWKKKDKVDGGTNGVE